MAAISGSVKDIDRDPTGGQVTILIQSPTVSEAGEPSTELVRLVFDQGLGQVGANLQVGQEAGFWTRGMPMYLDGALTFKGVCVSHIFYPRWVCPEDVPASER